MFRYFTQYKALSSASGLLAWCLLFAGSTPPPWHNTGFDKIDTNGTGSISRSELWYAMGELFSRWKPESQTFVDPLSRTGVRRAWDLDSNGHVDRIEFIGGQVLYIPEKPAFRLYTGKRGRAIYVFERGHGEKKTTKVIQKRHKVSPRQLQGYSIAESLFRILDKDGDGLLSIVEWPS